MQKIVINKCYGGFHLSPAQQTLLKADNEYDMNPAYRTNPDFIASVEAGDTGGYYANLTIVEIPENVHYKILDYDGYESIIWSESPLNEA